jgi:hypothetical protein
MEVFMYKTLQQKDVVKFLSDDKVKESYKMVGHQWSILKGVGKQYCTCCGLVKLNNKFTEWCIDKGCMNSVHPQYPDARHRYTKPDWII